MAEVAGLALSVTTLLVSCAQGYAALLSIRDRGKDATILACRLEIEEKRLVLWSRNAGICDNTCLIPASYLQTVITTLSQIEAITQDAATLKARYGLEEDKNVSATSGMVFPTRYLVRGPGVSAPQISKTKQKATAAKLGLRWLFDRAKFEKVAQDLKTLNDGLNALLQEGQAAKYRRDFAMMGLLSVSTDDVETLQAIRGASEPAYDGLARASDQRLHILSLQGQLSSSVSAHRAPPSIATSDLHSLVLDATAAREICHLHDDSVLLEWRKHRGESPETISLLTARTKSLAALLSRTPKPGSFRVLDCIGHCHDDINERFGLISSLPASPSPSPVPTTVLNLRTLLHSRGQSRYPLPALHDRFRLAAGLANSLLHMHASKWLHRSLSNTSVIFFLSGSTPDYTRHYISGFGYSREDRYDAVSLPFSASSMSTAHQHPDLHQVPAPRYTATYDAYSLGIILLEVGFWRPAEQFWKDKYTAEENRCRILNYQLSGELAHRMGTAYERVVRHLLCGEVYGDGRGEGSRLERFFNIIVAALVEDGLR